MASDGDQQVTIRRDLRPGDLGQVIWLHGVLYAAEYGFDPTFEAYVAETLGEATRTGRPGRSALWLAELDGRLVGSIGIVEREGNEAQLRWFLVHPDARRRGLGRRLVDEALVFCRAAGYRGVYLWTVNPLTDAARIYTAVGFGLTEETPPQPLWGLTLSEQRYDLEL